MNRIKIFAVTILSLTLMVGSIVPASAEDNDIYSRFNSEEKTFIQNVENDKGFKLDDENISYEVTPEGILVITEKINETDFNIYSNETALENDPYGVQPAGIISTLVGIYLVYDFFDTIISAVKFTCKAVEGITGWDGCGYLLRNITVKGKYKVTRYFQKNSNCQPMHSFQCNSGNNGYWTTSVTKVQ